MPEKQTNGILVFFLQGHARSLFLVIAVTYLPYSVLDISNMPHVA